ncbi:HAD family hydrolase [Pleomorphomonas oryzae]|uniref:HAD family hydrolase n=1 Tax=Pleomorphomonas oryzae TaxID=261934 RepID=UPI0003FAC34F|nr:HAD family hydrolase [Pleomorphomonas oryzae]
MDVLEKLAVDHRPVLKCCRTEPYPPSRLGWSVATQPVRSPSSAFDLIPRGGAVIEYVVWCDWDIGHLYDLEHVWVHVDAGGSVVAVEGSQHGRRVDLTDCAVEAGRPVVYLEPGKHAVWSSPKSMAPEFSRIVAQCGPFAGNDGVHVDNPFGDRGEIAATPFEHRLARLKLKRDAFRPAFDFSPDEIAVPLVSWAELAAWIPGHVRSLVAGLRNSVPHIEAVFLDCGDTLADEGTEVKDEATEIVSSADLIPGAENLTRRLIARGYRLALVADGPRETFLNILGQHGLWNHFEAHVISGDLGVAKPHRRMFETALAALGIPAQAASRVVMVGNNLERDIKGANETGLISVFLRWSTRRTHVPKDASEKPRFAIDYIEDLPDLLERIELAL